MYIHKTTSKFPHWVYAGTRRTRVSSVAELGARFEWCKDNFGDYGGRWLTPSYNSHNVWEGNECYFYPYRFKSLDDAMAFRLAWC